jgi:membrane associated rhomboid family serine protease
MSNFASGIEFPKGKATRIALAVVLASSLLTAVVHNLLGRSDWIAALILDGSHPWQVHRIVTAGLVGDPTNFWSSILPLLGLFFLGPTMESRLGALRFGVFLMASSLAAFAATWLAYLVPMPASMAGVWAILAPATAFGPHPWTLALVVAWSMFYPDAKIQLFFVLPVRGSVAKWFVFGLALLPPLLYRERTREGLIAIVAAFMFGLVVAPRWVWWTRFLDPVWRNRAKAMANDKRSASTRNRGGLRVLEGGRTSRDDDDPSMLN